LTGEQKAKYDTLDVVAVNRCRVSFVNEDGLHAVEVVADTLFEAVAQAVAEFLQDKSISTPPTPESEFTVLVLRPPVEHTIRLKRIQAWANGTTQGGPAEMLRRDRVRKLLANGASWPR
jgi:hypothetical protein